ncbi:hypothetical protein [Actinoplanes awajinensis]|uniref:Uncharacterized protein n=1 Tax=Actinoplanes awajinensis subsp. mycoplanecinus TaxID=135947 RepID=A0A101JKR0_9ACTN|nr:hypothetical protein [Actinoplanes awajinensis]KUL28533.1 hypothetical protein ADL15_31805 [Actinoplanes awajinensis subsp. mycoplanecinus]
MRWFRRLADPAAPTPAAQPPPPPGAGVDELDRFINRSAGRLPGWAVVQARWITDTLRAILDTTELEVTTVILVDGTAGDYLPTTLTAYLAVDESLRNRPRRDGRTPEQHLRDQLDDLHTAATTALSAVRDRDVDAMTTQSNFLRTKFSRSDLDLS